MMVQWSNNPDKPGPWNFICSDRKRFEDNDHGGTIYLMSQRGLPLTPRKEWGLWSGCLEMTLNLLVG